MISQCLEQVRKVTCFHLSKALDSVLLGIYCTFCSLKLHQLESGIWQFINSICQPALFVHLLHARHGDWSSLNFQLHRHHQLKDAREENEEWKKLGAGEKEEGRKRREERKSKR